MKNLYYVRHGQSVMNSLNHWGGSSDTPLTELGLKQAQETAKRAKEQGLKFDVIISSPLSRAHVTAQQIADATGYPKEKIVQHHLFIERNFGELEGTVSPEAVAKYIENEALIEEYKGVETMAAMQERANKALEYLHSLPYDTILVVGHGAFARALRRAITKERVHTRDMVLTNAEIAKLI